MYELKTQNVAQKYILKHKKKLYHNPVGFGILRLNRLRTLPHDARKILIN